MEASAPVDYSEESVMKELKRKEQHRQDRKVASDAKAQTQAKRPRGRPRNPTPAPLAESLPDHPHLSLFLAQSVVVDAQKGPGTRRQMQRALPSLKRQILWLLYKQLQRAIGWFRINISCIVLL